MQILIDRSSTIGCSNKSKCNVARHQNKKVLQNILIDKQNDFFLSINSGKFKTYKYKSETSAKIKLSLCMCSAPCWNWDNSGIVLCKVGILLCPPIPQLYWTTCMAIF